VSKIADTMPATMTHMQSQTHLSTFLAGGNGFLESVKKAGFWGEAGSCQNRSLA
jgi:hypothetical protein